MSLAAAPTGRRLRIRAVRSGGPIGYRLMELGLIEGTEVEVLGRAPLGDPIRLRVGDYDLSLRSNEASLIDVNAV